MARNLTLLILVVSALLLIPVGCGESLPAPSGVGPTTEAEKKQAEDFQKLTEKAQAQNAKAGRRSRR